MQNLGHKSTADVAAADVWSCWDGIAQPTIPERGVQLALVQQLKV